MNGKKYWSFTPFIILTGAVLVAISLLSFFWNGEVALAELFAAAIIIAIWILKLRSNNRTLRGIIGDVVQNLSPADKFALESFPLPTVLVSKAGEFIWYNNKFRMGVLDGKDCYGRPLKNVVKGLKPELFAKSGAEQVVSAGVAAEAGKRKYTVYGGVERNDCYQLYFADDTLLKAKVTEYTETRPVVSIIMVDNYDELMQNAKEGEKAEIVSMIEKTLLSWVSETTGFLRHSDRDKYIFILEERDYRKIVEKRFNILDKVRKIVVDEYMPATLSIGVGHGGKTFSENEEMARQALDMALGRGGDQAAVKNLHGYEFYGGSSKGVEKQTKVKTRIIASALSELIDGSDNVLIMGHKGTDLDTVGAAAGLYKAVQQRGRDARIVLSRKQTMAQKLIDYLDEGDYEDAFVEPDESLFLVTPKTLLIVVDTHRKGFVEYPELYRAVKSVVVIDHHRKMVDFIDNAVLFYIEPYASSASEMVAELLPYIADKSVSPTEASAMLAGMSLDTRNFTVRTGVRTFEAAAYLKRKGADITAVKRLFSGSLEDYSNRAKLVASAALYHDCAITASAEDYAGSIKYLAPQAADDLLTINGVRASFVLFSQAGGVNISARSLGDVNVQIIMEKLGGGGHLTMAGTQLAATPLPAAVAKVKAIIDQYFEEQKKSGG